MVAYWKLQWNTFGEGKAWKHDGKALEFLEVGVFFIPMKIF